MLLSVSTPPSFLSSTCYCASSAAMNALPDAVSPCQRGATEAYRRKQGLTERSSAPCYSHKVVKRDVGSETLVKMSAIFVALQAIILVIMALTTSAGKMVRNLMVT